MYNKKLMNNVEMNKYKKNEYVEMNKYKYKLITNLF